MASHISMTTTRLNEVRKALRSTLDTAFADHRVTVTRGYPEDDALDELIVVGDARVHQEPGAIGRRRRRESITVDLDVQVTMHAEATDVVADRALELFAEAEWALREDPTLGLKHLLVAGVSRINARDFPGPSGTRVALVEAQIEAESRL